ncbi:MAG TPA: hypothetical protein VFG06_10275 [Thermodesulfovibrionales bacterium]|nr:hypothetical protein [Thermodesulfovibrionales bacterium]
MKTLPRQSGSKVPKEVYNTAGIRKKCVQYDIYLIILPQVIIIDLAEWSGTFGKMLKN